MPDCLPQNPLVTWRVRRFDGDDDSSVTSSHIAFFGEDAGSDERLQFLPTGHLAEA